MSREPSTVSLGSITTWLSGGTPDRSDNTYWGGTIPWISASSLKATRIYDAEQRLTPAGLKVGSKLAPEGSILVLVRGMSLHRETRIGLATRPLSFNQDVKALVPCNDVIPEFLVYALQARSAQILGLISSAGSGTGVLDTALFKRLPIWLPGRAEQESLVESLCDADNTIDALAALTAKKEAIKQGMMQQLLTGQIRLPGFTEAWSTYKLKQLGPFLKGRGIKRDDVQPSGVACIRYGELYTVYRDYTSTTVSFVSQDVASAALLLRQGDLLFAGSGETRDEIGMCVAFTGTQPAVAGGDIIVLRASNINPVYLASIVNSPKVMAQKARLGQGDAVVHISSRALGSIELDLPPRDEQDAIAQVLIDADAEIRGLKARLVKAKAIKQGMMQQLLTGRTRLPPYDEVPA